MLPSLGVDDVFQHHSPSAEAHLTIHFSASCPSPVGGFGLSASGSDDPLGLYIDRWITAQDAAGRLRPRTAAAYKWMLRDHIRPHVGDVALRDLRPSHVEAMMAAIVASGRAVKTANNVRGLLRAALRAAVRDGLVARNAAADAQPRSGMRPEITPLSPAEVRRFLDHTRGTRDHPLYVVAISLGMRLGELLALRWEDVHLEAGEVRVMHTLRSVGGGAFVLDPVKTQTSQRRLPLPASARAALEQHRRWQDFERTAAGRSWDRDQPDLIFRTAQGRPTAPWAVTKAFRRRLAGCGIRPRRFHDLRHSTASFLLGAGLDIAVISKILGHASVYITADTYSHLDVAAMRAGLARLDGLFGGTESQQNP